MAYERLKLACGHTVNANVDGSYRLVRQRLERLKHEECDRCREQRNRTDGFIELWGSEKDKPKAERIRRRTLDQAVRLASMAPERERHEWNALIQLILRQNDAAWWCRADHEALAMLAQEVRL